MKTRIITVMIVTMRLSRDHTRPTLREQASNALSASTDAAAELARASALTQTVTLAIAAVTLVAALAILVKVYA